MENTHPKLRILITLAIILILGYGLTELVPGLKNLKSSILGSVNISAEQGNITNIETQENGGQFTVNFDQPGASTIKVMINEVEAVLPVFVRDQIKPQLFAVVSETPSASGGGSVAALEVPEPISGGSSPIIPKKIEEAEGTLKGAAEEEEIEVIPYADLRDDTKYRESILKMHKLGLMTGTDSPLGQVFNPTSLMDRAQFATVFYRLGRLHTIKNPNPPTEDFCLFTDLSNEEWYFEFVLNSCKDGLVEGYPDHTFQPIGFINYAEALAIVVRTAAQFSETVKEMLDRQIALDTLEERDWFVKYIEAAKNSGILTEEALEDMKEPWKEPTRSWVAEIFAHIPDL